VSRRAGRGVVVGGLTETRILGVSLQQWRPSPATLKMPDVSRTLVQAIRHIPGEWEEAWSTI
jgi:hypothetical protein